MEQSNEDGLSLSHANRFLSAKSVYEAHKRATNKQDNKKVKMRQTSVKVKALAASVKKKERKKPSVAQKNNGNVTSKSSGMNQKKQISVKINPKIAQRFLEAAKSLLTDDEKTSLERCCQEPESDNPINLELTDGDTDIDEDGEDDEQDEKQESSLVKVDLLPECYCDTYSLDGDVPHYNTLDTFDYEILNDSEVVAFIPFRTCFYFKGRLQLTVLSGIIEMMGYRMEENHKKAHEIYSPRGFSLNCINSVEKSPKNTDLKAIASLLSNASHSYDEESLQAKSSSCAIILLRSLDSRMIRYTSRLFIANIFKKENCTLPKWKQETLEKFEAMTKILDTNILPLGAIFHGRFYQQPDDWYLYTEKLIERAKQNETVRLMLLGGKGVGKSTLLRYILNRLIQIFGSVLVLDFDLGQSELFPAGCVSASLVTEPLLGPSFTHFQQPLHCYHIGDIKVDVNACPYRYIRSCQQLITDCKMNPSLARVPTLLNTMGFTRRLGLDLALDLIRLSQPLQVIQILAESTRDYRNYSNIMTHDYVSDHKRGWITSNDTTGGLPVYNLQAFHQAAEECDEAWGFPPGDLRDIGFFSYFSRLCTSPEWTLTDAVPYRISWHALAICVIEQSIPPGSVFAAINGNLVALCILDSEAASSVPCFQAKEGNYPTILKELPIIPCVGYGVVRNIDMKNGLLYLITPEPVERLERVNCLVMGSVHLPPAMLLDQPVAFKDRRGKERVQVPYFTTGPSGGTSICLPPVKYRNVKKRAAS